MSTSRSRTSVWVAAIATFLAVGAPAIAQEVGTVVSVTGEVEIGRGGTRIQVVVETAVEEGDEIRTGRPGRIRVVLRDDSVITLGDDSRLTIEEQVLGGAEGEAQSLLSLLQGKVNAVVSDHYRNRGSSFEVKTRTATAGVRGTEFIVTYDPDIDLTEIVGISGTVSVHGAFDPAASAVLITAQEATTVDAEGIPTNPERLDNKTFRQYLNDIDFISASLSGSHPLAGGSGVPQPDRAPLDAGSGAEGAPDIGLTLGPDASSVLGQSPAAVKTSTGTLGIDLGNP